MNNIRVAFFPANNASALQTLGRGVIESLTRYFRRWLVSRIILNMKEAAGASTVANKPIPSVLIC